VQGRIVVVGSSWALPRRVIDELHAAGFDDVQLVGPDELGELHDGVAVLVHLSAGDHDALARRRRSAAFGAGELLAAAGRTGTTAIVLLSSALVYGAWPNNPVPLTEDAALRPDNDFAFARQLALVEQLVDDWRIAAPDRSVAVLRPVPAMAADGTTSLARALAAGPAARLGEDDVPAQFLHLDDLAHAVVVAVTARLDGVYNVAPDGWVPGARVRALSGKASKFRLPDRLGEVVARLRWRFQRGPIPPGLRSYTTSPWVVANDRLRATGWAPTVTNEQAFVEGTEARWWTMLTPKRKQELSLGLAGVLTAAVLTTIGLLIRRARRRRAAGERRR
jgi:nucleoside-diphosphate-sugar epimerase